MRRIGSLLLLGLALLGVGPALAHEGHVHGPGPVVVVEIEGPMDQRVIDFAASAVSEADAQVVVLLIDSPGVASGDLTDLAATIDTAVPPVAAWVGPQGAEAYGGAAQLLELVDYVGAAPGALVGYSVPTVAGDKAAAAVASSPGLSDLADDRVEISQTGPSPDFIDFVTPSIGQFLAMLDGIEVGDGVIETVDETTLADGSVVTIPSVEVRFIKPGLFTRFLRLSIRPEAAFFFLVAGLALVAFEFYAAGVGVTAGVAALSLFLSAYGLSTLPVRWWAVGGSVLGVLLFTWDFQRTRLGWRSVLGLAALLVGGLALTDAAPQFGPRWWAVVLVVVGIALFYGFAMTTVVRARFSTPTIGREHLIGRRAVAETDFAPDGLVTVDGARWRASAARAADIKQGDTLTVLAVKEIVLEVEPE